MYIEPKYYYCKFKIMLYEKILKLGYINIGICFCLSVAPYYIWSQAFTTVLSVKFTCRYVYIWALRPLCVIMCFLNVFSLCLSVYYTACMRCVVLVKLHMLSTFDNQDVYLSTAGIRAWSSCPSLYFFWQCRASVGPGESM